MKQVMCWVSAVVLTLVHGACAWGDVWMPAQFSDGMVVQRQTPIPAWGKAEPGETVEVALAGVSASATAGADGRWLAQLPAMEAGGPHELLVRGSSTITRRDVMVGEVWIASGQSNMVMRVKQADDADEAAASADRSELRIFNVRDTASYLPKDDVTGRWTVATGDAALGQPAVPYYFGRELCAELNVPVGVIVAAVGNTPIQTWMSRRMLMSLDVSRPQVEQWERDMAALHADYAENFEAYHKQWFDDFVAYRRAVTGYAAAVEAAKAAGDPPPPQPPRPRGPFAKDAPVGGYSGMVAPLQPYAMRGVIWYQGESNVGRPAAYRELFPAMIRGWREDWGRGEFPFLFVQLASYRPVQTQPVEGYWPGLRDAQLAALGVPNTAMAVTIDIGAADNIHPPNKREVGRRLALAALAKVYGRDVSYSGPIFASAAVEGSSIRVRFTHTGGGLVTPDGATLRGFVIAGADRKFVFADARIEGDSVVVSSPDVPEPVAVRYAWADNPICNLYNGAGLPASPFRTDDWELPAP